LLALERWCPLPRVVAILRFLQLDDLGAKIREDHRHERARQDSRQVEHADTGEWSSAARGNGTHLQFAYFVNTPTYSRTTSSLCSRSRPLPSRRFWPSTNTYAHCAWRSVSRVFCSTTTTATLVARTCSMRSHTALWNFGESPADGSSSRSTAGPTISPRAIASIVRCPPLRVSARRRCASLRSGNSANSSSMRSCSPCLR